MSKESRCVLGACLQSDKIVSECVTKGVTRDCFSNKHEVATWIAIEQLIADQRPVDSFSVTKKLRGNKANVTSRMLNDMIDETPAVSHASYYIDLLLKDTARQRLQQICFRTYEQSKEEDVEPVEFLRKLIDESEKVVYGTDRHICDPQYYHAQHVTNREAARDGKGYGYSSSMPALEALLSGYSPPDNIILAGKSSSGKTSFAINEMLHMAKNDIPVAMYTTDMTEYAIRERMAGHIAGVNTFQFTKKNWNNEDAEKMDEAYAVLNDLPIFINDYSGATITDIIAWGSLMAKSRGVKLYCVDFLQQINTSQQEMKQPHRLTINDWSKKLKGLGKEHNMATLVLSQLSRYGEKTAEVTPPLPNKEALKESGDIENNADVVIIIAWEPGLPVEEFSFDYPIWDLVVSVAKHRNGPTGIVPVSFRPAHHTFMAREKGDDIGDRLSLTKTIKTFNKTLDI